MTTRTASPGWVVILLTMTALLLIEPRIPGFSHTAIWGGLASAFVLTLYGGMMRGDAGAVQGGLG